MDQAGRPGLAVPYFVWVGPAPQTACHCIFSSVTGSDRRHLLIERELPGDDLLQHVVWELAVRHLANRNLSAVDEEHRCLGDL